MIGGLYPTPVVLLLSVTLINRWLLPSSTSNAVRSLVSFEKSDMDVNHVSILQHRRTIQSVSLQRSDGNVTRLFRVSLYYPWFPLTP